MDYGYTDKHPGNATRNEASIGQQAGDARIPRRHSGGVSDHMEDLARPVADRLYGPSESEQIAQLRQEVAHSNKHIADMLSNVLRNVSGNATGNVTGDGYGLDPILANRVTGYGGPAIGLPKHPYPVEKTPEIAAPLNRLNMACNHVQDLEAMVMRLEEKLLGPQPEAPDACGTGNINPWGGHQGEMGNMAERIIQATVRMGNMLVAIEKTLP